MTGALRRRLAAALDRRLGGLGDRIVADAVVREHELAVAIEDVRARLERLEAGATGRTGEREAQWADLQARLTVLDARLAGADAGLSRLDGRLDDDVFPMLRALVDDEAANRRRLWRLREQPDYALAYTEDEPLVTISIPTHDRVELLMERSLPTLLAQTYEHLDILIVGDRATPELEAAVRGVKDPRVRFANVTTRVRQPTGRRWLTAATMPRNEAYRLARGRWTLDFDDDDTLRPDAVAVLLEHARASGAEIAYGDALQHTPNGSVSTLGSFPPVLGQFSLAAALVHEGLRFFAREHVAASMDVPGDWHRVERMLRVGVRFAHRPGVVHDYYPSALWAPGASSGS